MDASIFTPDLAKLAELETLGATRLFRDLLWCDAARLRLRNIFVSENTSTADGGIDAKAELPTDEKTGVKGSFHFQIKSGTSFKPWQPAAIAKELFGSADVKPSSKLLGKAVKDCMDAGGVYVVVVPGHDLLPVQHTDATQLLAEAFEKCGYRDPSVEVWGVSQLAQMMQLYPSLCLDFNGLSDIRLQTVESWSANGDMSQALAIGAPQQKFMHDVLALLRGEEIQHVRVVGEPGVGKTRMVLEALRSDNALAARTVYVPQSNGFLNSRLLSELLKHDREYWAVVVIDECEQKDRAQIFRLLKGRPRIKLLTIDHGEEKSDDQAMRTLPYPPLGDEALGKILSGYIGKQDVGRWVEWCEGSARVAHAVGDNLKRNPDDVLANPGTVPIWERFILGYKESGTASSDRLLTVARHIALFRRFGFRKPVNSEGKFIAALAAQADPKITPARFNEDVTKFLARRVLQGGHTLRLVPKALHVHLWREWWQIYGVDADLAQMLDSLPATLHRWFVDMLDYANGSPEAREAIDEVLSRPDGPFAKRKFIQSDTGASFLATLASGAPAATLALLENTVGKWKATRLEEWREGRDSISRALSMLAFWSDHFHPAATLLVRLAKHDTRKHSDDARSRLAELFHLGGGKTQAAPAARIAFIDELMRSESSFKRNLGLNLCSALLKSMGAWHGTKMERGMLPSIPNWRPEDDDELWAAWRLGVSTFWLHERPDDAPWQSALSASLIDTGLGWIHIDALVEDCLKILEAVPSMAHHDSAKLTVSLVAHLKYRAGKASAETMARLRAVLQAQGEGPFLKRFARFVEFETSDEDWKSVGDGVAEVALPKKRVADLVDEFVSNTALRESHTDDVLRSDGRRIDIFAKLLALKSTPDQRRSVLNRCFELDGKAGSRFLASYLAGVREVDSAAWETFALRLLAGKRPASWRVDAVMSSGFTPAIVEALIPFAREFDEDLWVFKQLGHGFAQQELTSAVIERFLTALIKNPSKAAPVFAMEIASYWFGGEKKAVLSADLHFRLLFDKRMLAADRWNQMESYHWGELAKSFIRNHPERELDVVKAAIHNKERLRRVETQSSLFEIVGRVCWSHPKESWPIISAALEDSERTDALRYWLGGDGEIGNRPDRHSGDSGAPMSAFNSEDVFAWIDGDAKRRASVLVDCLPRTFEGKGGTLMLEFIERYAADDDIASGLIFRFHMGSRSGPMTEWLAAQREEALAASSKTKSEAVRKWIRRYVASLSKEIDRQQIYEERRM